MQIPQSAVCVSEAESPLLMTLIPTTTTASNNVTSIAVWRHYVNTPSCLKLYIQLVEQTESLS